MKNYSLKATVFVVAALFSLFSLAQDEVASEKRPAKVRAISCTKNVNQWGHSSRCQCSVEGYNYSSRTGMCTLPGQENGGKAPHLTRNGRRAFEGCEGGEFSYDKKRLTCPNGRVYKEVDDTLGDISRIAASEAKDHIADADVDVEDNDGTTQQ